MNLISGFVEGLIEVEPPHTGVGIGVTIAGFDDEANVGAPAEAMGAGAAT